MGGEPIRVGWGGRPLASMNQVSKLPGGSRLTPLSAHLIQGVCWHVVGSPTIPQWFILVLPKRSLNVFFNNHFA